MARSMLKAKKMPAAFWGEAVSMAVFILNRAPTKSLKGTTPFEAWHGRKSDVSFLRTFGCVGHVKKTILAKMVSHAIFQYNVLVIDIDNTTLGLI